MAAPAQTWDRTVWRPSPAIFAGKEVKFMRYEPRVCPACPEKQYYGKLVDTSSTDARERTPRCVNCGRVLVTPATLGR